MRYGVNCDQKEQVIINLVDKLFLVSPVQKVSQWAQLRRYMRLLNEQVAWVQKGQMRLVTELVMGSHSGVQETDFAAKSLAGIGHGEVEGQGWFLERVMNLGGWQNLIEGGQGSRLQVEGFSLKICFKIWRRGRQVVIRKRRRQN